MKVVYAPDRQLCRDRALALSKTDRPKGLSLRLFYTSFRTAIGLAHVVWGPKGLLFISFPDTGERSFLKEVGERFGVVPVKGEIPPGGTRGLLERYFYGEKVSFSNVPLDLVCGTAFQQDVWRKLMEIPYGEVRSYGWVAREVGRPGAVRAVGGACGQNPLPPVVPCHRVVGSRGELTGYSGPGGTNLKRRLLEMESQGLGVRGYGTAKIIFNKHFSESFPLTPFLKGIISFPGSLG